MEHLAGIAAPNSAGPLARRTGSPAQLIVAYGAPAGGWLPPTVRAHLLGGRGGLLRRWPLPMGPVLRMAAPNGAGARAGGRGVPRSLRLLPMEHLLGMAAPNSVGPLVGGTGSPT